MARWWDHDKALARGSAPGTRAGKPMRLSSGPASREPGARAAAELDPPTGALLVVRRSRRPVRYFVLWVLFVLPLALLYAALTHGVAWWLLAIPFLRLFSVLVLTPKQWLALTSAELQGRDKRIVWSVRRGAVESIEVARGGVPRIEFADATGSALAAAPLVYTTHQLTTLADALSVRVVDHR